MPQRVSEVGDILYINTMYTFYSAVAFNNQFDPKLIAGTYEDGQLPWSIDTYYPFANQQLTEVVEHSFFYKQIFGNSDRSFFDVQFH